MLVIVTPQGFPAFPRRCVCLRTQDHPSGSPPSSQNFLQSLARLTQPYVSMSCVTALPCPENITVIGGLNQPKLAAGWHDFYSHTILQSLHTVLFFQKDIFSLLFHASLLHFNTMMAWISRGPFISFRGNSTPPEIRINGMEECTLAQLHEGGERSVKSNESSCQGPSSSLLLLLRCEAKSAYFGGVCVSYRMVRKTFEFALETSWARFFFYLSMMNAGKAKLISGDGKYYLGVWTS